MWSWFSKNTQHQPILERLQLANEIQAQHEDEKIIIYEALATCFSDEDAYFNTDCMVRSCNNNIFELRKSMLEELTYLLNHYPELEEGELTVDMLEAFTEALESHHNKIKHLVELYLPETYTQLREMTTPEQSLLQFK